MAIPGHRPGAFSGGIHGRTGGSRGWRQNVRAAIRVRIDSAVRGLFNV